MHIFFSQYLLDMIKSFKKYSVWSFLIIQIYDCMFYIFQFNVSQLDRDYRQ